MLPELPLNLAVQVNVPVAPPPANEAMDTGLGLLKLLIEAVPELAGVDGVTVLSVVDGTMLFLTCMESVAVSSL